MFIKYVEHFMILMISLKKIFLAQNPYYYYDIYPYDISSTRYWEPWSMYYIDILLY